MKWLSSAKFFLHLFETLAFKVRQNPWDPCPSEILLIQQALDPSFSSSFEDHFPGKLGVFCHECGRGKTFLYKVFADFAPLLE
jgi:hypothetical protein